MIALIASALVLAIIGEQTASDDLRAQLLNGHEWLGWTILLMLGATIVTLWFDRQTAPLPLPNRLQALTGWFRASHEVQLTGVLGFSTCPFRLTARTTGRVRLRLSSVW